MNDAGVGETEFPVGSVGSGGSRTITDAEIAFLPALMGAISPLFHDEVTATDHMGGRILYGPALLGISVALTEPILRDRVVALVGIDALRFRVPVRAGDTVTAEFTVRDSSIQPGKPHVLLHLDDEVRNQRGETVLTFSRAVLLRRLEPADPVS
jgi:acyl dehydratase